MPPLASPLLAATIALAGAAHADTLIRRGGEWRSTVTGVAPQPQTMEMCFAQTTMQQAMSRIAAGKTCATHDVSLHGNQMSINMACGMISMQGTATIAGDTAYTADLTMTIGSGPSARTMHTHTVSTWIGDCKPGEKPLK